MGGNLSLIGAREESLGIPDSRGGSMLNHRPISPMGLGHRHRELELNLVVQGNAGYLLGDRRYSLRRNTMVWLFPGQDHILLDKSENYAMCLGLFKPWLIESVCHSESNRILAQDNPSGYFCRQLGEDAARSLERLCVDVAASIHDLDRLNAGLAWALLSGWDAFNSADDTDTGMDLHPAVDRAVRLIRSPDAPEGLQELAEAAGLSLSRLSKVFKKQMGVGLVEFRNRRRIETFLKLYSLGRRTSITEAALAAGFGSYPQFHRVFRDHMGCSPAEYRRTLTSKF
jgi:AraC-like DNA-binding protein